VLPELVPGYEMLLEASSPFTTGTGNWPKGPAWSAEEVDVGLALGVAVGGARLGDADGDTAGAGEALGDAVGLGEGDGIVNVDADGA
jgi:hypothetical protein